MDHPNTARRALWVTFGLPYQFYAICKSLGQHFYKCYPLGIIFSLLWERWFKRNNILMTTLLLHFGPRGRNMVWITSTIFVSVRESDKKLFLYILLFNVCPFFLLLTKCKVSNHGWVRQKGSHWLRARPSVPESSGCYSCSELQGKWLLSQGLF